jgi:hypothetical protein
MLIGTDFDGVISHTPLRRILSFVGRPLGKAYRHAISTARPNWWAIQLIHELQAEGHEVVIITGTPKMFQPERSAWMERHGIGQLAVYYNPKSDFSTKQQIAHKSATIKRLGVKVFVEDQPRVAKGIARLAKVEVVLHVGQPKETAKEVRAAIRDVSRKQKSTRRGAEINRAAPTRARKCNASSARQLRRRCFNGAAPPRGIHTTTPSVINIFTPPPKEYVTRDGKTTLGEVRLGDRIEVYYPVTGNFFRAEVLTEPKDKEGIYYIDILDKNREKQRAVWSGNYFVLGDIESNPTGPQIVISVPHAIGMPVTGRMKGHDYIAEEMARKLAERLSAVPLYLVVGDIPRDVLDLNRERARWKTNFRHVVRDALKRDPQNTIHLDVHSFRINSKVYAGNDIAIATTEKRARPHEIALRDHLLANGVRCRIYTEMLMDVVPEGRELGVAVSYLIEFNEGSTPEQKNRYADLVSDFILRAALSWPPEWPSVSAEATAPRASEPQANPAALRPPTRAEMQHEEDRIDEMNERQLRTRLGRMTIPQKVYAFALALSGEGMEGLEGEAIAKLAALGYDEEGHRIKPRRPRRTPAAPRPPPRTELVPWAGLHVGDLVEIPTAFAEGARDNFAVVHHLGTLHEGGEVHGYNNSVWGLWESTPEAAERKYLNATESDLHPFLPGLLKHSCKEEAAYKILRTGILRPQDNRTKIEMLEGKGATVKDGEVEMYYAVPSGMPSPYGTLQPNFEYSEGEVILVSTHPEIGLQLGEGLVLPVKVPVAHLSFLREYPHRADFQLGAPDDAWPLEPADFLGEPFNVRAVGLVRANPDCVLCSDLKTPKVYYEDPFIIICDDIKHDHSILAMIKRHAEKPEDWERKWLMRVLNYIAGEAFPTEFEIEQTMNTVPTHYHVHAVGENPLRKDRSALEIISSVQEIAHR